MVPQTAFKFRHVSNGQAVGFRSQRGNLDEKGLLLGDAFIEHAAIKDTLVRDNRLVLALEGREPFVIHVYGIPARELEKAIDRYSSARQAELSKAELERKGEGHSFRTAACPACGATIDLSGFDKSSYVYCRFCESLLDRGGQLVNSGDAYRVCDECGLFDRVKGYTEFYFYFLLVVYGFSSRRRHVCDNCAHRLFLKTFFINLIFLVGIIPSLVLKFKSMSGRATDFAGLPRANKLASKGRFDQADREYTTILQKHPEHPGILFNQAMGHLKGGDAGQGIDLLKRSLKSCTNYLPSARLAMALSKAAEQA
ncbi:MAG: hypothetical protein JXR96_21655 [Deltaproteobacteria bacterium]|nr:hypothetical protein [Deltaproteobacteria bacterium]